jgi:hypothetical protein
LSCDASCQPFRLRQDAQDGRGVGPGLCELRRIPLLRTPVNRRPTKAYARREQQARVPKKAGELGRVKNILAASTRQDWEAHGPLAFGCAKAAIGS